MKRQKVLWIPRAVSIVLALSAAASAQFTPAPGISMRAEDRISLAVDDSRRASLLGNVSPRINSGTDLGPVAPSFELPYVTLVLTPSAGQQADLDRLLTQQQDSSSPDYHRWLTPEQYAERFGVSQSDIDKVVSWLGQHGLTLKSVARSRNAIAFGGAADQIGSAFGVQIHSYNVGAELHYANSADPTIPAAFQGVVLTMRGLHDFRLKPRLRPSVHPRDNFQGGEQLAPDDIATIYNITPLYNAGIDGTGQKLAIVGQTDIILSDIDQYRSYFNLPVNNLTTILVPGSADPGVQSNSGDLGEADLDLEFAGAVARNATIYFVNSTNVEDSLSYAITDNVAPIVSTSYGDCELDTALVSGAVQAMQQLGMQANVQGQTVFAAAGDAGALDCYGIGDGPTIDNALSVDMPASLPQVTGVGGTQFNEGSGTYWSSTNTSSQASALSWIPEIAWNEGFNPQPPAGPEASGGGVSVFFCTGLSTCLTGAAKPSWQTGTGVPADGARDVPDVSLSASPAHDGYLMVSQGSLQIIGGTSVGGPQFAGIAALLSQYLIKNGFQSSQALGDINPQLYQLASVAGVFHDITTGNNSVPDCQGCAAITGYSASPGYDQVTGLGTPDVYNLVVAWHDSAVQATKITPAPGTVLSGALADFSWNAVTGATQYQLLVGTTPGGSDIFGGTTAGTSQSVGSIPCADTVGGTIYVQLAAEVNGSFQPPTDYTYKCKSGLGDFNGDGYQDVLWQNNSTHQVTVHYFDGTQGVTYSGWNWLNSTGEPSGWVLVGAADFDGNGVPDLVWEYMPTGQVTVNYYGGPGGATLLGWNWLNKTGNPGWTVVAVADMNGDGVPDLIWEKNATNQVTVNYYGGPGGATLTGWNWLNIAGEAAGWHVVAAADFDGNGTPDLVWQYTPTRQVTVHYYGGAGGATYQGWNWLNSVGDPGWTVVGANDFNGDGVPDLVWQNDKTAQVTVNYYGGAKGASLIGWNWLASVGYPGWTAVVPR